MNTPKKRGWIFGGAAALVLIGTVAQLSTSRAQTDALAPAPVSTNLAPAEMPKLPADLSPGLGDVIKLTQSNVGDDVVVGYIKNSGNTYKPTADEILYLNDLGVSQEVINALMLNGKTGDGSAAMASTPPPDASQQIPTPPSNATLSSPEVPTYAVTQDAPLGGSAPGPEPGPVGSPTTTVVEQTPPPEVTVNYFYDQLSPYGSWVDVEGYGRCWRPSVAVVNNGWRPYCDNGYWVNTDAGWYWRSYYSWGWAPFHYGRWCSTPRFGWCWVPDCTWGPAWVAWREHDRYCGWAALPPYAAWRPGVGIVWAGGHHGGVDWGFGLSFGAFTFVGYDHFTDHHPWRHQPPRNEVANIFNHSKVINNTVIVNKTTIINNGIPKERITQVTHKPVQTVVLRDTASASGHGRVERVGGKPALAVYRPSTTVIAKTASTPVVHNKPVLINSTSRTGSPAGQTHSTFGSPTRTSASYSPRSTPLRSSSASVNSEAHQAWPGENLSGSSPAHSSPAISKPVASGNNSRSFGSSASSHEPAIHSTTPANPSPTRTVEQPANYYGSGNFRHSAAAPSAPVAHSAAPSYSGGHASGGGGAPAAHSAAPAAHADRTDNGRGH